MTFDGDFEELWSKLINEPQEKVYFTLWKRDKIGVRIAEGASKGGNRVTAIFGVFFLFFFSSVVRRLMAFTARWKPHRSHPVKSAINGNNGNLQRSGCYRV